jgi:hypothetical protein
VDFLSLIERGINAPSFETIEQMARRLPGIQSDLNDCGITSPLFSQISRRNGTGSSPVVEAIPRAMIPRPFPRARVMAFQTTFLDPRGRAVITNVVRVVSLVRRHQHAEL